MLYCWKLVFKFLLLTDTGEDSKLVHRQKCPKVDTLFSSPFFQDVRATRMTQRRVEILASTFGRFRLYRLIIKFIMKPQVRSLFLKVLEAAMHNEILMNIILNNNEHNLWVRGKYWISSNSCFILETNVLCQSYDRQPKSNLEILEGFSERWNIIYYTYYNILL